MKLSEKGINRLAWGLVALTTILSVVIWGQNINWNLARASNYKLFPLFGLLAFGLMWGHYVVAAARVSSGLSSATTEKYFEITSFMVLVLILSHPGLLVLSLWRDGFGLPPASYLENYVRPGLKWAALLGSLSLLIFLFYELRRVFRQRPWWKYVQYASDVAMLAILVHGFKLGSHVRSGWFQTVWVLYGLSLLACLGIIYKGRKNLREDV